MKVYLCDDETIAELPTLLRILPFKYNLIIQQTLIYETTSNVNFMATSRFKAPHVSLSVPVQTGVKFGFNPRQHTVIHPSHYLGECFVCSLPVCYLRGVLLPGRAQTGSQRQEGDSERLQCEASRHHLVSRGWGSGEVMQFIIFGLYLTLIILQLHIHTNPDMPKSSKHFVLSSCSQMTMGSLEMSRC